MPTAHPRRALLSGLTGLLSLALALASVAAGAGPAGEVAIGQQLREAELQGLNGPTRKLSEFRRKPLIINVWASWCGPCREESASLERLAWREPTGAFTIIGISTDDYAENAQAWLKQSNATINQFIDRALTMETMLGASRLPLTVLVDADGRVIDKIYGAREWDRPAAMALIARAFQFRKDAPAR
jgi:thiol-disulfide isomerase/thioredoxin